MNHLGGPLVSVCIPCYKNPELFTRCLQSVIGQTYSNIEIIITDDSPNDEVLDVLRAFSDDLPVQYVKNSPSLGSPENWNAGLRLATGQYIKIMHHDDWFETSDALAKFVSTAIDTGADFVCSACYNVGPDKKEKHDILKRFRTTWAKNRELILYANYVGNPSTVLFRRPEESPVWYDRRSIWYVDVLFYYEYVCRFPKVAYIDEHLLATSAGLETQVTNSAINAKIVIGEFLYVVKKFDLVRKHSFLTKLTLIELMKRHNITSKMQLEREFGLSFDSTLPYYLLKFPVSHQFFNILKHLAILL